MFKFVQVDDSEIRVPILNSDDAKALIERILEQNARLLGFNEQLIELLCRPMPISPFDAMPNEGRAWENQSGAIDEQQVSSSADHQKHSSAESPSSTACTWNITTCAFPLAPVPDDFQFPSPKSRNFQINGQLCAELQGLPKDCPYFLFEIGFPVK